MLYVLLTLDIKKKYEKETHVYLQVQFMQWYWSNNKMIALG